MPTDQIQTRNREAWLHDFLALSLPLIRERTGLSIGENMVKLSCGFPSRGGTARKKKTIGQCFHSAAMGRKTHEIFIHPALDSTVPVGETVYHEVLHALLPPGAGHRKPFSQAAKKLGLDGKPTATYAGDELKERILEIAAQIGSYPHESLDAGGGPKQTTRLLKAMCPICGYIVRVTTKWIDEAGPPICPQCMTAMIEAGTEDVAAMPLVSAEQHVVYKVKKADRKPGDRDIWDPRWFIQMHRSGNERPVFSIIDYGPAIADDEVVVRNEDGTLRVEKKARLVEFEAPDPRKAAEWVLGENGDIFTFPRHTRAQSRDDAIGLMESLRDGSMNYDDIDQSEDDGGDVDDPYFLDEDETEIQDSGEDETDMRFRWEIEAGIDPDEISPEAEQRKREAWVGEIRQAPPEPHEPTEAEVEKLLAKRVKELERLQPRSRRGR